MNESAYQPVNNIVQAAASGEDRNPHALDGACRPQSELGSVSSAPLSGQDCEPDRRKVGQAIGRPSNWLAKQVTAVNACGIMHNSQQQSSSSGILTKEFRPDATLSNSQQTLQLHNLSVRSFDALHWTKATSIAQAM